MDRKDAEKRFEAMKQEAQSWRAAWQELAKYISPTRGFFDGTPNSGTALDHKTVVDGSPSRAARILASGMTSGLTSPSRPWFKLGLNDIELGEYMPVKMWLGGAQSRMMAAYSKSNIYGVLHSIYEEIGTFGTASALILEDPLDVIRGRNFTAGEYFLGSDASGRVNSFGREYWMTVGQIVEEFGIENVSSGTKNLFELGSVDKWVKVRHLIEPNKLRKEGYKDSKNMAYRSCYWEIGAPMDMWLRESGFEDFPVLAPRWGLTTTADIYGRGPGWDALGDVKMLQKMQRDKLIALAKSIDPPVQKDASIQGDVNTLPGGITYSSGTLPNAGVRPAYQIQPDLKSIEFAIERTQGAIRETFYSDLFLMLSQSDRRQMTAREVAERSSEKLLVLGPVLERLESELLDPLIDRTFNIMLRNGMLPPPPPELEGVEIKVEYISTLAQAQKMVGTTAIEQGVAFVGNVAAAFPQVLDVVNPDEAVREYGEMLGLPPKIIRSPEEIDAIRKQKQQAAAAAQQAQMMGSMVQGAKVMSDTKIGQNSALDAMLGTMGKPGEGVSV